MASKDDDFSQQPLPEFRADLELYEGPQEPDGSSTWSLYDPVRAQYFRVTWKEAMILRYWRAGMTLETLLTVLSRETTMDITADDVRVFFEDAGRNLLLLEHRSSDEIWEEAKKYAINPFKWLIFHYLYFRVPLFNPMPILKRTAWIVKPFVSRFALTCYIVASIIGIMLVLTRLDDFFTTFTYFFNLKGILAYIVTIILVKFAHEFAHAYAGYFYGVNVPTIGMAFIILWPVLYTDVTDSWKLPDRRDRLAITTSGVITELVIAGLSTLGWAITEPGVWHSLFFVVATTTWISSLMVNCNPAMKFDGYYILSDLWGIDNLQNRAFAMARWKLRQWFLGLENPPPEEGLSHKRQMGMVFYSLFTWAYRILMYVTIGFVIYLSFTKALGVTLMLVSLWGFLIRPLVDEATRLKRYQGQLKLNTRLALTCTFLGSLILWFVLPWPHTNNFPAITAPIENQVVYIPSKGIVEKIHVSRGEAVEAGDLLMEVNWKPLDYAIQDRRIQQKLLESEIHRLQESDQAHAHIPTKQAELEAVGAQLQGMLEQRKFNEVRANVSGIVYEWDEDLRPQQAVKQQQVVGKVADTSVAQVVAYIPEEYVQTVETGIEVEFRFNGTKDVISGVIRAVHPVRERLLQHHQLASINGGQLPTTREGRHKLVLIETYYEVIVELKEEDQAHRLGQTGELLVSSGWESKLVTSLKYIGSIFWQESGF